MFPLLKLSNGVTLGPYQRLTVIALKDFQQEWRKGSFVKIKKGDKCSIKYDVVRFNLCKEMNGGNVNYRVLEADAKEGIDFKVIAGEKVYP